MNSQTTFDISKCKRNAGGHLVAKYRNGDPAIILTTKAREAWPIISLNSAGYALTHKIDGRYSMHVDEETELDLLNIPEKRTIEFIERGQSFIDDRVGKLERERDEARNEMRQTVKRMECYADTISQPIIKERDQLKRERDAAREQNNVQCNNAWLETIEKSGCYLTTDGKIVSREVEQLLKDKEEMEIRHAAAMLHTQAIVDENTQLRKIADELAFQLAVTHRETGCLSQCPVIATLANFNQLPHVKERNEK